VNTSLLKKLLARKPFKKRLERKQLLNLNSHNGVITSLLKKLLARKPFEKTACPQAF
jgi:hypothetical protein